ncbi:MAG TPA: PAS domain S-box protein [Gemmatimonadales bacterium]|nr:PAS domain S-box protein [Gemmatimonadales bacterium]
MLPAALDFLASLTPRTIAAALGVLLVMVLLFAILFGSQFRRRRRADREAAAARGHLQSITASMREGVIAYDMQFRLVFANPAFERLTGFPVEDLRDQEFLQYVHPDDRRALVEEWDRLAQGGSLRDQEYRVVTRSGPVRWTSSSWEPLRDEAGRQIGFLGTEFDITERKLAEEAMQLDTELFQAVIEIQQAVAAAGLDSATVVRVIADRSQWLTGATGAVIEAIEGDDLVPLVHLGTDAPRLPIEGSLSGLCVRSGELQRSDDLDSDPRLGHAAYRDLGIRSILVVPLKDEQRTLGVLKVVSTEPAAFSDRDAKALRLLGGLMGAAMAHAATFESRQSRLEERTRALQESEQRFKQLVDVAQEGIWVADDRGVITYVNHRMGELLGHPNGALLGRQVYDFIDAGSRASALRALARPSGGERLDLRFRQQDGGELWGLVSASPITGRDGALVGSVGMLTDITERKRTEERLRRSAERLTMLHDMDQAILAARSPAEIGRAALGRLRRMVPCERCSVILFDFHRREARLLAGFASGQALSAAPLPLEHLSPADVLRRGTVRYAEDIAEMEEAPPLFRQLREDGIRSVLSVPLLVDGEAIGEVNLGATAADAFDAEHRDIALEIATPLAVAIQHARLREELARKTGELERRLAGRGSELRAATAELETLLYSVSHDLRTPLRHISGFAQLLAEDAGRGLDPAIGHYAERIQEGAGRMAALLDDLVTLSRVGRQDLLRRDVPFATLVEDVLSQLQPEHEGRLVNWQIEDLPVLDCDPTLARLALHHLIGNALKFTRSREHAVIRIRAAEADDQTAIMVEDNGVGFKMAYASKLFGVFQRLHRSDEFEGNGAGLALVQRIAQKHGGRVWAEGDVDRGAKFFITFGSGGAGQRTGEPDAEAVDGGAFPIRPPAAEPAGPLSPRPTAPPVA